MTAGFEPDLLYVVRGETSCPDSAIVFKKGLGTLRPSYNIAIMCPRSIYAHIYDMNKNKIYHQLSYSAALG
jgi:hypothetical protein